MPVRSTLLVLAALAAVAACALWQLTEPRAAFSRDQWQSYEQGGDAARGRIVFEAGGCASCHATPGQPDRLKLGGGLQLKSPFGSFTVPNISPHPDDGIGAWKVVDLANAMLTGVSPSRTHYYPAFPYTSFQRVKIEDVRDLMTFLRTLAPVSGKAGDHDLSFPFNIRRGLGLWKLLFLDGKPLKADPAKTLQWNRGRYLVEGLGHCAECHSPRNILGAVVADRRFAGGPNLEGKGRVPNITPDASGLGPWSQKDIAELLTSGLTPDGDSVGGAMAEVIRNTAELPPSDREAIAEYLKSLPPRQTSPPEKKGSGG
ncbi:cytochrome c [Methylocapsa sp. S129]|uniref:cytochrome c n=1 Tax=Methylocapsa sp. S129 TaxID=1641869 RepID=UPI00131CF897|nr:cytochrome c [Methylocapsa sp. S129]